MKKITLFLSAMLFSLMSMAQTTVKMDFTTAEGLDALGIPQPTVADGSAHKTDLKVGSVYTQEGVTFTATKHGSAATRIWKTTSYQELRHYKGGVITIGAPAGKVITKIELTGYTAVIGFENVTDGVWEGSLSSVDLTAEANAATIKIQTITVTLGEGGETPDTPDTPDEPENPDTPDTPDEMITCAEAAQIAAAENYKGTENVTVFGYVVELGQQKTDDKTERNKQCFYMSDTEGGEKQFMAYWAFVPDFFEVGDKVAVTGILQNYKGTIEIADGEATLLSTTSIEEVFVSENPIKVIHNGQVLIIRGENVYNVLGAQVK